MSGLLAQSLLHVEEMVLHQNNIIFFYLYILSV